MFIIVDNKRKKSTFKVDTLKKCFRFNYQMLTEAFCISRREKHNQRRRFNQLNLYFLPSFTDEHFFVIIRRHDNPYLFSRIPISSYALRKLSNSLKLKSLSKRN
ncbi:CLUMA_CG016279, isoform D [Clunio marinus]|uniref:CLUMA_CG016279, isoform D n=1 Tax=Clunio marinus TaxID=568069 RepID=A0A1J1IVP9_9DIPT|nr:CLUMA_CG016279, isoform D [Clunio marinus]